MASIRIKEPSITVDLLAILTLARAYVSPTIKANINVGSAIVDGREPTRSDGCIVYFNYCVACIIDVCQFLCDSNRLGLKAASIWISVGDGRAGANSHRTFPVVLLSIPETKYQLSKKPEPE